MAGLSKMAISANRSASSIFSSRVFTPELVPTVSVIRFGNSDCLVGIESSWRGSAKPLGVDGFVANLMVGSNWYGVIELAAIFVLI